MAREVGLQAVYVDVESVERHTREAEVIVNNGHITAGINLGYGRHGHRLHKYSGDGSTLASG